VNSNLNDVAAEALEIFKVKLSGAVANDARLYECRKILAMASTRGLPYEWERFDNVMLIGQPLLNQAIPPLTEAAQANLLERMNRWVNECLSDAEKRAGKVTVADPRVAARGSIAASGSGVRHPGKKL
jgi:hypothetical protein